MYMRMIYVAIGKVVVLTLAMLFITYRVLLWTFAYIPDVFRNEMYMIMFGSFIGGMGAMLCINFIIEG
jgi:hypothetical protein